MTHDGPREVQVGGFKLSIVPTDDLDRVLYSAECTLDWVLKLAPDDTPAIPAAYSADTGHDRSTR